MKNSVRYPILAIIFAVLLCTNVQTVTCQDFQTDTCPENINSGKYSKSDKIQQALNTLTRQGIPGAVAAIFDTNGLWTCTAGYSKIENLTPMQDCHLQYLQSISKTYLSVAVMQLYEQKKIDLNNPVSDYLPSNITAMIPNADRVSVKMLLTHTSGLPEYNYAPLYITRLLQEPTRIFQPVEYIEYIKRKDPDFEPGSKYAYRNLNYVLLALIVDQISGDHAKFIRENILDPLGLTKTHYRIQQGNTYGNKLVNSYWDRHGNGILENISVFQNTNVASMVGDDGIVTTPAEAILFLKALMEGKLVSKTTLELMVDWALNENGDPEYGFGLDYAEFLGVPAIGHSGGGLGSGCQLYYFPSENIYMFLGINLGTVTYSIIHDDVSGTLESIYEAILRN